MLQNFRLQIHLLKSCNHSMVPLILALILLLFQIPPGISTDSKHSKFNSTINSTAEPFRKISDFLPINHIYINRSSFNKSNLELSSEDSRFIGMAVKRFLLSVLCLSIIATCLVGNMLVIIAVIIVRKLHTQDNASNFLIVSLAVSDLLVGVLVMPYAFYVELSEENKWYLGAILCDIWTMSDVLLCTASILNLVAISVDRYFIILHAMVYTQRRNARLMFLMILVVWLVSALISIPPLFGFGKPSSRLDSGGNICAVSSDLKYQIFATMLAFYLPLITMIIIYINIYRAAEKLIKKEQLNNGTIRSSEIHVQGSYPLLTYSKDSKTKEKSSKSDSQSAENFANSGRKIPIMVVSDDTDESLDPSNTYQHRDEPRRSNVFILNQMSSRLSRRVTQVFNGFKRNSNVSNQQKKIQKSTMALGVIMGCFILCWLPFFILALIKPISLKNGKLLGDFIPKWLDSFLLWLGYFNSALNPMIYARFNREFRRPFIEILCFRCYNINEKLRDLDRKKMNHDIIPCIVKTKSNQTLISTHVNQMGLKKNDPDDIPIQMKEQTIPNDMITQPIHQLSDHSTDAPTILTITNRTRENANQSNEELSKLTDPNNSLDNTCNSSKLNNFFQPDKNKTPVIICSEFDANNNVISTVNISTEVDNKFCFRKRSFDTSASSYTLNSNITIFDQLEQTMAMGIKNELSCDYRTVLSETFSQNEFVDISVVHNQEQSEEIPEECDNTDIYKKNMLLKKKFFMKPLSPH